MSNLTHVICGFSGTLKSTISKLMYPGLPYIESPTKYAREFNDNLCEECLDINPIHNLMVRFFQMRMTNNLYEVVVERSIYDFLFFAKEFGIKDFTEWKDWELKKVEDEWNKLAGDCEYLIIKNDAPGFISDIILGSDKSRNDVYSSTSEYLEKQDMYLSYLTSHIKSYKYMILTDSLVKEIITYSNGINLPWK